MGGGGGRVEVVKSNGCSRLSVGLSSPLPSFKALQPFEPASPASSSIGSEHVVRSGAPLPALLFALLVYPKKQGNRSRKQLKIRWPVQPSLTSSIIKSFGQNGIRLDEFNRLVGFISTENSCIPVDARGAKPLDTIEEPHLPFSGRESNRSTDSVLSGHSMYVDLDISSELRNKVIEAARREGVTLIDQWFVGCRASHVVCEGSASRKYLGHSINIVTPLWVLKTAKEKYVQRLVHMSADLARQVGMMLEESQNGSADEETNMRNVPKDVQAYKNKANHEKRQRIVNSAKAGVRNRRGLPFWIQSAGPYLNQLQSASIYTENVSVEDATEHHTSVFFDAKADGKDSEASFANLTRLLKERLLISLFLPTPNPLPKCKRKYLPKCYIISQ
ncbi:hypothetical protein GBA52_028318 [Prunus armeniaca]|nr:hypothetical protein GBA52_028318 [Prunus armeniaca]